MSQVTLDLAEYNAIDTKIRNLKKELESAKEAVLRVQSEGDRVEALLALFRNSLPVIQFAVANLDSETVRGWPHEALEAISKGMKTAPGLTEIERETSIEFHAFAREALQIAQERAEGTHKAREGAERG